MKRYRWSDVPPECLGVGITRRLITGSQLMAAEIVVPGGRHFAPHRLASEQLTFVVKGRARYVSAETALDAQPGDIICIPAGVEHTDEVLEDIVVIDLFSPPREDWLKIRR